MRVRITRRSPKRPPARRCGVPTRPGTASSLPRPPPHPPRLHLVPGLASVRLPPPPRTLLPFSPSCFLAILVEREGACAAHLADGVASILVPTCSDPPPGSPYPSSDNAAVHAPALRGRRTPADDRMRGLRSASAFFSADLSIAISGEYNGQRL